MDQLENLPNVPVKPFEKKVLVKKEEKLDDDEEEQLKKLMSAN